MTPDQVVFLLLVVLVFGGKVVVPMLRRAARRAHVVREWENGEKTEVLPPVVSARRLVMPAEKARPRRPQGRHHRPLPALVTVPRRDVHRVALREARRGIVLMAVLGPCRGLGPASVFAELDRG